MLEFDSGYTVEVFKSDEITFIRTTYEGTTVDQEFSHEDFAWYVEYLASKVPG